MGRKKFDLSKIRSGVLPDVPNERDLHLLLSGPTALLHSAAGSRAGCFEIMPTAVMAAPLPEELDLSKKGMPSVENQQGFPWCIAYAMSSMVGYFYYWDLKGQDKPGRELDFCEEWAYSAARKLAGCGPMSPEGVQPRDMLELVRVMGFLPERGWDEWHHRPKENDPEKLQKLLSNFLIQLYAGVTINIEEARRSLYLFGPLLAAVFVYSTWEGCFGILGMPPANEAAIGRHGIVICGYSQKKKSFLIRNSWGDGWGIGGYAWMPYDLFLRSCYSLWSAVDVKGSKDLYKLSDLQKLADKWPDWLKKAFGIDS